jgi:predicted nuclease with TOPRIM domain
LVLRRSRAQSAESADAVYDLERLDAAITALVETNQKLRSERDELRSIVADHTDRIRTLESEALDANQRRQDVAKRVDELIGQIDQLDAQLESAAPAEVAS